MLARFEKASASASQNPSPLRRRHKSRKRFTMSRISGSGVVAMLARSPTSPTTVTYFDALSSALHCNVVLQAATVLLVLWLPRAGLSPRRS
jgi:hypothetical protein